MKPTGPPILILVGLFLSGLGGISAREAVVPKDYDVLHYGNARVVSPARVVGLDNNHEILKACRKPSNRTSLSRRGITASESQFELLSLMGLLDKQGDSFVTRIPILGPSETKRIRVLTASAASSIAGRIEGSVVNFKKELGHRSRGDGAYPLLFSYILDGLVWESFGGMGLLRPSEDSNSLWSGDVWSISPSRGVFPGTITIWYDKAVMYVMWTEEAAPIMTPFMADDAKLRQFLRYCVQEDRTQNSAMREVFSPYGLIGQSGECAVPIFSEEAADPLYEVSNALAKDVARQVSEQLDLAKLVRDFNFRDPSQALVVVYHELMWDLVDHLVQEGFITQPPLLADPFEARPGDVGELLFIVRKAE